ncbi:MAG: Inosine-5'-monophosphate dehydrogenase [Methanoregula sp. PtaU1.Bin051]|nr:MAG: Inosine-5'-monophosphate dehydrogenase [Methanoregula sp. PtaU1.Bin051]
MKLAQDFLVEIPVLRFNDRLTKARQILRDDRFREVYVVNDRKKLLGFVDITDGLRVTATKSNVTVEGFVKDAAEVYREDTVEQLARQIRKFRTDSAVVIDKERFVIGGVLLSDIFPVIVSRNKLHGTVKDFMSRTVVAAQATDTIQHVYTLVLESGYSAFPVLKKKKLAGMISRRDLIAGGRVRTTLTNAARATVESLMVRDVFTIGPDEAISTAADLLVRHDVSRLPVLEGESLVGIVSRHDVLSGLR